MLISEFLAGVDLETRTCEFKRLLDEGKDAKGRSSEIGWLKTLVAFANTDGGDLYVGIDDRTHGIVALSHDDADRTVLRIHRLLSERVTPDLDYEVIPLSVPDTDPVRYVLDIRVRKSRNLPVSLHENGLMGIYVRNFGTTDMATPEQVREMVMMSEDVPYDQLFTDRQYEGKDFGFILSLAEKNGYPITMKALISRKAVSQEGRLSRGALLFSDEPGDSGSSKIVATCWPGIDKGSSAILASEQFEGNLARGILWAASFVKDHSVNGFRKEAVGQSDYISYPSRSITEGIVNAVAHRNYYMKGTQVEINIFRDRLEITSPGSLLGVRELRKEKDISSIVPRRRNEVICAVLEMLRFMESKGSGFDRIEADYAGYAEAFRPFVSADANSFTLTLPDLTFEGGPVQESGELRSARADRVLEGRNDARILGFCYGRFRTVREIADFLGVGPSTYFRRTVVDRLVQQGLLVERKSGKAASYSANQEHVFL